MWCRDCGTQFGSRMRVFSLRQGWHTLALCRGCIQERIADGEKVEDYADWCERREDERADRALAER